MRHLGLQHREHLHRKHAHLGLGQPEDRVRGGDGEVAHRQQAHAARHARAVDPRDEGHVERARRAQQVGIGAGRRRVVERKGIRAQVGAGAERLVARAGEHDGADRLVRPGAIQGFLQGADHFRVERIPTLRAVDGENQPGVLPACFDDRRHA